MKKSTCIIGWTAAAAVVAGLGGMFAWQNAHRVKPTQTRLVYDPSGYGGFVAASPALRRPVVNSPTQASAATRTHVAIGRPKAPDLVAPARTAYTSGNFAQAQAYAEKVIAETGGDAALTPVPSPGGRGAPRAVGPALLSGAATVASADDTLPVSPLVLRGQSPAPGFDSDGVPLTAAVQVREQAAQALQIAAYSAARLHNLPLARTRFALLEQMASRLPDGGAQPSVNSGPGPTLAAEGAYEYAVCTSALGDKKGAEAEYYAFLQKYPDSPLVSAAIWRISRLHDGNVPAAAQVAWKADEKIFEGDRNADELRYSDCAPECVAELLRRRGEPTDLTALTKEMKTNSTLGTSLASLAAAARRYGWQPAGVELTERGLTEQKLPLVALVNPGHYVIVDKVGAANVTVWDPDARGIGLGGPRTIAMHEWTWMWHGMALALGPVGRPIPMPSEARAEGKTKAAG